jgi:hypothetical protein
MKCIDKFTKRLNEVERESKRGTETSFRFEYTSQATALAQTLTGMAIQTLELYEMTWGRGDKLPPASDAQKLRWLKPYIFHPDRLDAIRLEWAASSFERDKVALRELNRLLPLMSL